MMNKQLFGEKYQPGQAPIDVLARHMPWWFFWVGTIASGFCSIQTITRTGLPEWMYVAAGVGITAFAILGAGLVAKLRQRGS